jgi:hypothetical protein
LASFQLNPVQGLKNPQGRRVSKYQLKNFNNKIFFKDKLKFPLTISTSLADEKVSSNFVYLKHNNLHFNREKLTLSNPMVLFQKLSRLTTSFSLLRMLKK